MDYDKIDWTAPLTRKEIRELRDAAKTPQGRKMVALFAKKKAEAAK